MQSNLLKAVSAVILLTLSGPFLAMAQVGYLRQEFKQPKPFLYEVEKDGKVSHILGSMHAGIPLSTFPDSIFQLSVGASNLAFEADPDEFKSKYSKDIQAAALYPKGQSLEQELSPKSISKLKELFGEKVFAQLNKYKPWAVANELSQVSLRSLKNGDSTSTLWDANYGVDMTLLRYSKTNRKSISYLDDLSKKVKAFEQDTSAADLDKLLSYPDPIGHISSCALMAQRAYLAGSEEGFKAYNKSCETQSFLARLQERTVSWIPKMEPLLKNGNAFIVVGADHMNGPNGLETLLKAKGYSVKRIGSAEAPVQNIVPSAVGYPSPGTR